MKATPDELAYCAAKEFEEWIEADKILDRIISTSESAMQRRDALNEKREIAGHVKAANRKINHANWPTWLQWVPM